MKKNESVTLPVLALIFGVVSFLTSFTLVLGAFFGITSIILAIVCFIRKNNIVMPVAGLVFSIVGIIIISMIVVAYYRIENKTVKNDIIYSIQQSIEKANLK